MKNQYWKLWDDYAEKPPTTRAAALAQRDKWFDQIKETRKRHAAFCEKAEKILGITYSGNLPSLTERRARILADTKMIKLLEE